MVKMSWHLRQVAITDFFHKDYISCDVHTVFCILHSRGKETPFLNSHYDMYLQNSSELGKNDTQTEQLVKYGQNAKVATKIQETACHQCKHQLLSLSLL